MGILLSREDLHTFPKWNENICFSSDFKLFLVSARASVLSWSFNITEEFDLQCSRDKGEVNVNSSKTHPCQSSQMYNTPVWVIFQVESAAPENVLLSLSFLPKFSECVWVDVQFCVERFEARNIISREQGARPGNIQSFITWFYLEPNTKRTLFGRLLLDIWSCASELPLAALLKVY